MAITVTKKETFVPSVLSWTKALNYKFAQAFAWAILLLTRLACSKTVLHTLTNSIERKK